MGARSVVVSVSRSKACLRELGGDVTVCETACTGSSGECVACVLDVGAAVVVVVVTIAEGGELRGRERGVEGRCATGTRN